MSFRLSCSVLNALCLFSVVFLPRVDSAGNKCLRFVAVGLVFVSPAGQAALLRLLSVHTGKSALSPGGNICLCLCKPLLCP